MIKEFLLGKIITIGFFSLLTIFLITFLLMLDIPTGTILLFSIMVIALFSLWLYTSYMFEMRRFKQISRLIEQVEDPYLIGTILPSPISSLEKKYFELMQIVSHDAISKVERNNQQSKNYKEYVEGWIHELKTPLTAMSLILANSQDVQKLRRELKRADNLTDNILHYARLQTLEKDKQLSEFSLSEVLNSAVKNQMDVLIAAKMQVKIEGDFTVYTDQKAIQFIMNQLLINSAKYAPNSTLSIRATTHYQLIYEDNGIGILKHELPRIFERGYTGTNGRRLGTSTGMGLYIVATLCKGLNISIEVQSEVGQFTRFILTFPTLTKM